MQSSTVKVRSKQGESYNEPRSDAGKPLDVATRLGQVFTPPKIADQMVAELSTIVGRWQGKVVLDPCVGTAALPQAIVRAGIRAIQLKTCELDPELANTADEWLETDLAGAAPVIRDDFLELDSNLLGSWDVAIANPPYIRQEWIASKERYQLLARKQYSELIPGTANLYVYFIVKLVLGLRDGGAFAVVVYDSWAHTFYGRWLVDFLNAHCDLLKSIPVSNAPFDGHLIDATILIGRRSYKSGKSGAVLELKERSEHREIPGFVQLHTEYWTKRGLRLKQASFFMGTSQDIELHGATPFVKKSTKLSGLTVRPDHPESALLVPLEESVDHRVIMEVENRMALAKLDPDKNQSILNWYRERPGTWARHPTAPQAPILFNYYFRARPRHVYNPHELQYADNFYGVRPKNGLPDAVAFALLNATSTVIELQACSRRQGNGLQKLQLFEYRNAWIPGASMFSVQQVNLLERLGRELATNNAVNSELVVQIDRVVYEASSLHAELEPSRLASRASGFWNAD